MYRHVRRHVHSHTRRHLYGRASKQVYGHVHNHVDRHAHGYVYIHENLPVVYVYWHANRAPIKTCRQISIGMNMNMCLDTCINMRADVYAGTDVYSHVHRQHHVRRHAYRVILCIYIRHV